MNLHFCERTRLNLNEFGDTINLTKAKKKGGGQMIYTVTFNPSLDYIVGVDDFRLGATNRTSYEQMLAGALSERKSDGRLRQMASMRIF